MAKRFRMSTALDVDDLLLECIPYALRLANERYHFDPPISIYEVDRWGKLNSRAVEMSRNVQSGNTQNLKSSVAPVRLPAAPASTPGTSQAATQAGCVYRP